MASGVNLKRIQVAAVLQMMEVEGPTIPTVFKGQATRILISQTDTYLNAMRGKTDDKLRFQCAMIEDEIEEAKRPFLKPGAVIHLTQLDRDGAVEQEDFVLDSGVYTFFLNVNR